MPDETPLPHTQINQICDQFEDAWKQNEPINIAEFLAMAPPAQRQGLLKQLLLIDIEFRRKTDDTCDPVIYTVLGPEAVDLAVAILGKKESSSDQQTMDLPAGSGGSAASEDSAFELNVTIAPEQDSAGSTDSSGSKRIGRYKLLQEIGEGGMGTVWMAEQQEPVRRRVALKVIKTGMDTKHVIARFEAERQALALMDHQNIARVLDAGTTDEGLPYFVMELVKGIPYVDYCNKNRLNIKERLELFVPVCKAIQHAHQKGIIHRDLKPSNVLVTLYDGHPVPKVIDFGLAKALDQQAKLTDRTMFTEFGQVVGTLQYMSPEQAEINALDVDTRTDVYSLGVMLYELLTGTTPIEMKTLKQNALLKVLEDIRETDPPRPSIRLSESGDAATGFSEQRKIEPARLQQMLRGELDWIVMKSLEKDRTRRYETASAFVDDIQRYLADEAVEARPASAGYLLGKFVKKHRGLVATVAALTGLLIAGIIGTSYGLIEAQRKTAQVVEQKQRADGEATNARAAEKIAKQKEAEAATEAVKSRKAEARAKQNEQRAVTAQRLADMEAENARAAEKVAKQKESEAATEAEKSRTAEALAKQNEQRAVTAQNQVEKTLARSNFFLAVARWSAGRIQDSREFLGKIPTKYRRVEWGLLRQLESCEMTLYGQRRKVTQVSFSADQSRIVSAGRDIKIWDAATGSELKEIKGEQFVLNPAGGQIATRDFVGKIKLFDLLTGEEIRTFWDQPSKLFYDIQFSHDGKQIAASGGENTISFWDSTSGKLLRTINAEKPHVKNIYFSPDGKWIAGMDFRSIRLWDTSNGKLMRTFRVHPIFDCKCFSVSPDGRWIATGSNSKLVKLWDSATGQEVRSFTGHTGTVTSVNFHPNGQQIVSSSNDGTVKLWDLDSGQEIVTYRGHSDRVTSVAFSPDGTRIVSGCSDRTVKTWDATQANNLRLIRGHGKDVNCICFSPDGKRIASGSISSAPKVWDAVTGELIAAMTASYRGSSCIAFKHDGTQIISGEKDGTIRLWDASNGDELLTLLGHRSPVTNASFSSDDTLIVSADQQATVKLWDAEDGKEIRRWENEENSIKDALFSPDDKHIITTMHTGAIRRWDIASGKELESIDNLNRSPGDPSAGDPCIAFSADGTQFASGSQDRTIKIYDASTGKKTITLRGHVNPVTSLSFSPDGKRIVSISGISRSIGHTVKLWDVATGEELISLDGQSTKISNIVFNPDGSMIAWAASSTDSAIKLWDVAAAEEVKIIKGIGYRVPRVVTDDDGTKIIVSIKKKKTIIWESKPDTSGLDDASSVPQTVSSGKDLLLVDPSYRNSPREKAFRRFKAKIDPSFHANQAAIAERKEDWYVATFHRAWELTGDPNRQSAYGDFERVYEKLQAQYEGQKEELTDFLSPQVIEVAGWSRPESKRRWGVADISKAEADDITRDFWQKVRSPNSSVVKNGTAALSQAEIDSLRDIRVNQFQDRQYFKTLMVAEYRLNHLKVGVTTAELQIKSLAKFNKTDLNWSPVELAVLAMSYHKLGNQEKTTEYRTQLNEAMKLEKYRDDEDSKSFFAEANELLGPVASEQTDAAP